MYGPRRKSSSRQNRPFRAGSRVERVQFSIFFSLEESNSAIFGPPNHTNARVSPIQLNLVRAYKQASFSRVSLINSAVFGSYKNKPFVPNESNESSGVFGPRIISVQWVQYISFWSRIISEEWVQFIDFRCPWKQKISRINSPIQPFGSSIISVEWVKSNSAVFLSTHKNNTVQSFQ